MSEVGLLGKPGSEGTHTRGTGGNKKKLLSPHTCCKPQPSFCCQSCGTKESLVKLKQVACFDFVQFIAPIA